jgi:hypothetical protein
MSQLSYIDKLYVFSKFKQCVPAALGDVDTSVIFFINILIFKIAG